MKRANKQGSIWQSGGGYRVAVVVGYDADGKAERLHGSAASREEAERVLVELRYRALIGQPVTSSTESVEHFLTRWLEDVARPSIRESSHVRYTDLIGSVMPYIGSHRLCDLRPSHLQSAYAKLTTLAPKHDTKSKKPRKPYSASTVTRLHAVLHNAFHDAVGWDLLEKNPADYAKVPRVEKRHKVRLSRAEAQRLFTAAGDGRWRALWVLLSMTGMRLGEALDLRWSQVGESKLYIPDGKTDAAERFAPITATLRAELVRHRAWQTWHQRDAAGDRVFCTAEGGRIYGSQAWRAFKQDLARAGLRDMRPHDLRGTHINWLRESGVDLDVVRVLVGHSDISTTDRHYLTITEARLLEAAAALERYMAEEGAG